MHLCLVAYDVGVGFFAFEWVKKMLRNSKNVSILSITRAFLHNQLHSYISNNSAMINIRYAVPINQVQLN